MKERIRRRGGGERRREEKRWAGKIMCNCRRLDVECTYRTRISTCAKENLASCISKPVGIISISIPGVCGVHVRHVPSILTNFGK